MGLGSQDQNQRKEVAKNSGVKGDWKDKLTTINEFEQMLFNIQTYTTRSDYGDQKIKQLREIIKFKKEDRTGEFNVHCHSCGSKLYSTATENLTFREFHSAVCKPKC